MNELEVLSNLKNNFPVYARECLYIKTKASEILPLKFNEAQEFLHKKIEEHKSRTGGKLRIVVLKARQFGISTYVEARFLHRTTLNEATNTFIMADSRTSANNIFDMTKRYYERLPKYLPKPNLQKSNEKALVFEGIDSSFRIGTAGAKTTGRSMTNQLLHCSEVGFWENADDIITGLFQTVPDNNQSEIILESTAKGVGGFFYDKVMEGLEPDSEWETIFLPWFWHKEYSKKAPDNIELTEDEMEIKSLYELTNDQIYWRRMKIRAEFRDREHLFAQEYPSTIQEAFVSTQNGLIQGKWLEKARKSKVEDKLAPMILGVDPARDGDRTVLALRKGRVLKEIITYNNMDSVRLTGIVKNLIKKHSVAKCFIDVGCGYGTIDSLKEDGYGRIVKGIPFNSGAIRSHLYTNKRTEMFGDMRDWFMDEEGEVRIPDDQNIIKELSILPDLEENSNGQWKMLLKEKIKKDNGGMSTDIADAIALTFAGKVLAGASFKPIQFKGIR